MPSDPLSDEGVGYALSADVTVTRPAGEPADGSVNITLVFTNAEGAQIAVAIPAEVAEDISKKMLELLDVAGRGGAGHTPRRSPRRPR